MSRSFRRVLAEAVSLASPLSAPLHVLRGDSAGGGGVHRSRRGDNPQAGGPPGPCRPRTHVRLTGNADRHPAPAACRSPELRVTEIGDIQRRPLARRPQWHPGHEIPYPPELPRVITSSPPASSTPGCSKTASAMPADGAPACLTAPSGLLGVPCRNPQPAKNRCPFKAGVGIIEDRVELVVHGK